jgi:putrescine aminotransferase
MENLDKKDTFLWHPCAPMGRVRSDELVLVRGEGVWVWDRDDEKYLDACASLWHANVGHGRQELAAAAAEQMQKLETYMTYNDYATEPALRLARRLSEKAPVNGGRVFFGSGGGDGIETAIKIARRFAAANGEADRTHVISRTNGYHGLHGYGTSVVGIDSYRVGLGPLAPDVSTVQYDSIEALRAEVERVGPGRIAAVIAEPVIGSGGVLHPPEGYLEQVSALCHEIGALFIADEVICGFGRLGTWFGSERFGITPDIICFAKGVSSGYLPLGGAIIGDHVAAPFFDSPDAPTFMHGTTFSGHATVCAVAEANLDILERENLIAKGRELEGDLAEALHWAADDSPIVREVRAGLGLMGAIQLTDEALSTPGAIGRLFLAARAEGILVRPLGNSIAVSPPLIAEPEHFERIGDGLAAALERCSSLAAA